MNNLKKYNTEELKYILSLSKTDIESELKKRIDLEEAVKNNFFKKDSCYIEYLENGVSLIKFKDIEGKNIIYDEFLITKDYINIYENISRYKDLFKITDFHQFSPLTFKAIQNVVIEYENKKDKLLDSFIKICESIINIDIDKK